MLASDLCMRCACCSTHAFALKIDREHTDGESLENCCFRCVSVVDALAYPRVLRHPQESTVHRMQRMLKARGQKKRTPRVLKMASEYCSLVDRVSAAATSILRRTAPRRSLPFIGRTKSPTSRPPLARSAGRENIPATALILARMSSTHRSPELGAHRRESLALHSSSKPTNGF